MADGVTKRKDEKPRWRVGLAPDMRPVSHDLAAVLVLHHLDLAMRYFGTLDLDCRSDDDDTLEYALRGNRERYALVMRHLEARFAGSEDDAEFGGAVRAFLTSINDHWDAEWRDEYGPGDGNQQGEG